MQSSHNICQNKIDKTTANKEDAGIDEYSWQKFKSASGKNDTKHCDEGPFGHLVDGLDDSSL
jgi:hypothetical protein